MCMYAPATQGMWEAVRQGARSAFVSGNWHGLYCHTLPYADMNVPLAVGLGWIAAGVKGEANLRVWAPKGVAITMHDALVPDYAKDLERPGFGSLLPGKQLAGVGSGSGSKKGKR